MDSTASSLHLRHKERQGKAPLDRMKRALLATGHSFFRGIFRWKTKTNGVAKILRFPPKSGPPKRVNNQTLNPLLFPYLLITWTWPQCLEELNQSIIIPNGFVQNRDEFRGKKDQTPPEANKSKSFRGDV